MLRGGYLDKELSALQGRYVVERLEENGKPEPPDELKKFSVAIRGTKLIITMAACRRTVTDTRRLRSRCVLCRSGSLSP